MRRHGLVAAGLATVLALSGCSTFRDREWGSCAIGGGIIGGTVGGITAPAALNNTGEPSDGEMAGAIAGGIIGGALIGAILGHAVCDPFPEPPKAPAPPPPPPPAPQKIATLKGPHFDFDKSTLKPAGERILDDVAKQLQGNTSVRVVANGYTDSVGSDAYNMRLSERRAQTVKDYLVKKGVAASRISVRGFGKSNPVASNATAEGRAENRRVELVTE